MVKKFLNRYTDDRLQSIKALLLIIVVASVLLTDHGHKILGMSTAVAGALCMFRIWFHQQMKYSEEGKNEEND